MSAKMLLVLVTTAVFLLSMPVRYVQADDGFIIGPGSCVPNIVVWGVMLSEIVPAGCWVFVSANGRVYETGPQCEVEEISVP